MTVSLPVARFLKTRFGYNLPTLYVYDDGEKKFSLETCQNPVPAPTIMEAIEFLWRTGIKIYNIPEKEKSRGVIQVGERKVIMKQLRITPTESYIECLEFLSQDGH